MPQGISSDVTGFFSSYVYEVNGITADASIPYGGNNYVVMQVNG